MPAGSFVVNLDDLVEGAVVGLAASECYTAWEVRFFPDRMDLSDFR